MVWHQYYERQQLKKSQNKQKNQQNPEDFKNISYQGLRSSYDMQKRFQESQKKKLFERIISDLEDQEEQLNKTLSPQKETQQKQESPQQKCNLKNRLYQRTQYLNFSSNKQAENDKKGIENINNKDQSQNFLQQQQNEEIKISDFPIINNKDENFIKEQLQSLQRKQKKAFTTINNNNKNKLEPESISQKLLKSTSSIGKSNSSQQNKFFQKLFISQSMGLNFDSIENIKHIQQIQQSSQQQLKTENSQNLQTEKSIDEQDDDMNSQEEQENEEELKSQKVEQAIRRQSQLYFLKKKGTQNFEHLEKTANF